MSTPIFRRELFDPTPGVPTEPWRVGRHVIQQKPGEPIEFFYIWGEGGIKHEPARSPRVMRWHAEAMAELRAR